MRAQYIKGRTTGFGWLEIQSSKLWLRVIIGNGASAGWALLRIDWKAQARSNARISGVLVADVDEADIQARKLDPTAWARQTDLTVASLDERK